MTGRGGWRRTGQVLWHFRYHVLGAAVALALWDTPLVKPFRVYVVMVHEMAHAAAALGTGGQVLEIHTAWDESGMTLTRGGFFPLICAAGYVGSAALGALLIYVGVWPSMQRLLLGLLGAASAVLTVYYTPVAGIDFALGLVVGSAVVGVAIRAPRLASVLAVWLGIMLCLYSLYDFRTDLWARPAATDAGILARHWQQPWLAYPLAAAWVLVSQLFMYGALRGLLAAGVDAVRRPR